ncbi:MAG: hypothetical protein ACR2IE_18875 [Candidatus Sumerlaeaceae bacterium]
MAKKKRSNPISREPREAVRPAPTHSAQPGSALFLTDGKLTLRGYVLLNLTFDGFCVFQLLFIRFTLHETRGLYFFFGLLMLGFFIVSVYDYAYDRLVPGASESE